MSLSIGFEETPFVGLTNVSIIIPLPPPVHQSTPDDVQEILEVPLIGTDIGFAEIETKGPGADPTITIILEESFPAGLVQVTEYVVFWKRFGV